MNNRTDSIVFVHLVVAILLFNPILDRLVYKYYIKPDAPDTKFLKVVNKYKNLKKHIHFNYKNSVKLDPLVKTAAEKYEVEEDLIRAVIVTESKFKVSATSHVGAKGLMQLMPSTAEMLGVVDIMSPQENINGGTKYLKKMLNKFKKTELAVAAYNAGPGAVLKYGRSIPPYKETRDYVDKVLKTRALLKDHKTYGKKI